MEHGLVHAQALQELHENILLTSELKTINYISRQLDIMLSGVSF